MHRALLHRETRVGAFHRGAGFGLHLLAAIALFVLPVAAVAQEGAAESEGLQRVASVGAFDKIAQLTAENGRLADERQAAALPAKLDALSASQSEVAAIRERLDKSFKQLKSMIEVAGPKALGVRLLREQRSLPELELHRERLSLRERELQSLELRILELEGLHETLSDLDRAVADTATDLSGLNPEAIAQVTGEVRSLLSLRRKLLAAYIAEGEEYAGKIRELTLDETALVSEIERAASYIDERILWVKSTSPISIGDFDRGVQASSWLFSLEQWKSAFSAFFTGLRAELLLVILVLLAILGLVNAAPRSRKRITEIGQDVTSGAVKEFRPTIVALGHTVLLAAILPLSVWLIGAIFSAVPSPAPFAHAIGAGLQSAVVLIVLIELLRQLCRRGGIADDHFDWSSPMVHHVRWHLTWFMLVGAVASFVSGALEWHGNEAFTNSLGRFAFIVLHLALALLAARVFNPKAGVLNRVVRQNSGSSVRGLLYLWYSFGIGVPLVLVVLSGLGYHYTATQFAWRFWASLSIIAGLLILEALFSRWLTINQARLQSEQAPQEPGQATPQLGGGLDPLPASVQHNQPDVALINQRIRQFARIVLGVLMLVGVWFTWADVLPALRALDSVELWSTTHTVTATTTGATGAPVMQVIEKVTPVTLRDLLFGLLMLGLTVLATRNIPGFLEISVFRLLSKDSGTRHSLSIISRYLIGCAGAVIFFSTLSVDWSKLQWLVAALGLGIGFGLQEIVANFICGLIILITRPFRVGDLVTVREVSGKVTRIQIRATTVTDFDRKEVIIPNKTMITDIVSNWTLTDEVARVQFPVGIAYGKDMKETVKRAMEILLEIAKTHRFVLKDPAPTVIIQGFGESSINLELRVLIPNRQCWHDLRNEVLLEIMEKFEAAGIEIPFPQQDIHIRSVNGLLVTPERESIAAK